MSEVAWAAGFFDGEGCIYRLKDRNAIRLSVTQTQEQPLTRFMAAVSCGKINGPYMYGTNKKPYWLWCVTRGQEVSKVMTLLWPWLCAPKKAQYEEKVSETYGN